MFMEILKAEGYSNSGYGEATHDLLSTDGLSSGDLGYDGEYPFPSDFLKPLRAELTYSTSTDPTKAIIYDISDSLISESDEDVINSNFSQNSPYIRFGRDSFFIRPLKTTTGDITGGIHIWYTARQSELEAGDTPVLEANFHRIYPLLLAKEYAMRDSDKYNALWDREIKKLMDDIRSFYRRRFKFQKVLSTQTYNFS